MYTSVEQWMHDADFAPNLSVAKQIGVEAFPQAIAAFKRNYTPYVERWQSGDQLSGEEKVVLVEKLKLSSGHIGSQQLRTLSMTMAQSLEINQDMPIDPLMSHLEELLLKLDGIK